MGVTANLDYTKGGRISTNMDLKSSYKYSDTYKGAILFQKGAIIFPFIKDEYQEIKIEFLFVHNKPSDIDIMLFGNDKIQKVYPVFREIDTELYRGICYCSKEEVIRCGSEVAIAITSREKDELYLRSVCIEWMESIRKKSVMITFGKDGLIENFQQLHSSDIICLDDGCMIDAYGEIKYALYLDEVETYCMEVEVQQNPNNKTVMYTVLLNNEYEIPFVDDVPKSQYRKCYYNIPKEYLVEGKNIIKLVNKSSVRGAIIRNIGIREQHHEIVTLITTNDIHGRFLGEGIDFAKLAALKKYDKNCVFIDSGDPTQGTPLALIDNGKSIIELMNKIGYDILTIGNHEFDNITTKDALNSELAKNILNFDGDFISSNVNVKPEGKKKDNFIKTLFNDKKNGAYCLYEIGNFRLFFIGFTTPTMSTDIEKLQEFEVEEKGSIRSVAEAADILVNELRKDIQIDAVIAVAHLGSKTVGADYMEIVNNFPSVDIILDGHSHEKYRKDVEHMITRRIVKVIQTNCNATHFGLVRLEFYKKKLINIDTTIFDSKFVNAINFEGSDTYNKVAAAINEQKKKVDEKFGAKYAENLVHTLWGGALEEDRPYPMLKAVNIARYVNTNMGMLTAESMVKGIYQEEKVQEEVDVYFKASKKSKYYVIGGINGGAIRDSIACDHPVTLNDLCNVLPSVLESQYDAGYCVLDISLKQLKHLLENSISAIKVGKNNGYDILIASEGKFLNTYGIKYTIAKDGDRLVIDDKIELNCYIKQGEGNTGTVLCEGHYERKFSETPDERVFLCLSKYIANGGDGYKIPDEERRVVTSSDRALCYTVGEYIMRNSTNGSFLYPPVTKQISYNGFDFEKERAMSVQFRRDGKILEKYTVRIGFAKEEKQPAILMESTTKEDGKINVTRPQGASVLIIQLPDGREMEMFMHSYFNINSTNNIIVDI